MKKGISTNLNCADEAQCLKEAGIEFVGRYYSTTTKQREKKISISEALALSKAGLSIIVFYQDRMNQTVDFSTSKGKSGGKAALDQATSLGQPKGSAIYFSVDYDPSTSEVNGPIKDYFEAVQSVFEAAGNPYKIGVYGSGLTCRLLLEAGLVERTVISQSTGFRESKTFEESNKWSVVQRIANAPLCELTRDDYEPCLARDGVDIGAFTIGSEEIKPVVDRSNLVERLIVHAQGDLGVEEEPRGSNAGPRVEAMLATTGNHKGDPWCASAIATWGVELCGREWPLPKTASCDELLNFARKRNILKHEPKKGDVFLVLASATDATHTGLVTETHNDSISTIEGNTNPGGSREGFGVFERKRNLTDSLRFIRWIDLLDGFPIEADWTVKIGNNESTVPCITRQGKAYAPLRDFLTLIFPAEEVSRELGWANSRPVFHQVPLKFDVVIVDSKSYAWVRDLADMFGKQVQINGNSIHLV